VPAEDLDALPPPKLPAGLAIERPESLRARLGDEVVADRPRDLRRIRVVDDQPGVLGERRLDQPQAPDLRPVVVRGVIVGAGDLRFYGLVPFGSMTLVPPILLLFPARYTGTRDLVVSIRWYAVAKACEYFDRGLLRLTGVSGHAWKRLASAAAAYWILRMLERRRPLSPRDDRPIVPRRSP
jgi:hypothetical protein